MDLQGLKMVEHPQQVLSAQVFNVTDDAQPGHVASLLRLQPGDNEKGKCEPAWYGLRLDHWLLLGEESAKQSEALYTALMREKHYAG